MIPREDLFQVYYFAYGSNMDENDLKQWCENNRRSFPDWKLLGNACLENYELSFNYYARGRHGGAANLMELSGRRVYGLLFEMSEDEGRATIRKKEGYPDQYEEILVTVECDGRRVDGVTTYKVAKQKEQPDHQRPTAYYMDLILKNARKYGFPAEYIQFLERIETQRSVRGG
ncbi:gamma-glutamylcyclotransferase family protein [Candidatus Eisenbacteria bacterium]|uniref:Gamma-glutamylcyclotransferase family protein n=1 Tax=Eiseniibacteriota bacterium TaxID=2212470 RepID=A0ABV6YMU4_UNCEI